MSQLFKQTDYAGQKNILAYPDGYECIEVKLEKATSLAVADGDRKVVKAGAIYPANDATAYGIILNDYDVTDGDVMGALLIAGAVNLAALPAEPAEAALPKLKRISFISKTGVK